MSKLVDQVKRGGEVIIARAGRPVARLVRVEQPTPKRLGLWKGKIRMSSDFDAPLSHEEQAAWEGNEPDDH